MNSSEFDRTKIYERLDYQPQPEGYNSRIPWLIQQQVSATNGIHYGNEVGHLNEYPIPNIPIPIAASGNELMLDIGCGWGRWLIAAAQKNYIPIGADLRLEFCEASRYAISDNGFNGYAVVADLKNLPFQENTFSLIWSFSVIQHTHKERMLSCLSHIHRMLKPGGQTKLEFPNKNGLRNRFGPVKKFSKFADDYNSWCVRYYTVSEYRQIFDNIFQNFQFENHSFLGIGVLPNDLNFVKDSKSRFGISMSLALSACTNVIPGMKNFSDSIYITAKKNGNDQNSVALSEFLNLHRENPSNNLNLLPILRCPKSSGNLTLSDGQDFLVSHSAKVKYPIVNQIPILIESEAVSL